MKTITMAGLGSIVAGVLLAAAAQAQPGSRNPPLMACGKQGEADIICGARAPEDFEVTPDGKFLIVGKMMKGENTGFDLFDLAAQKFAVLPLESEAKAGWGEANCKSDVNKEIAPHGISLAKRTSGEWQLFVVNHTGREAMEMYELKPAGASWKLVWHGCVMADKAYNDVAGMADGGFVATRPQAIQKEGQDLFKGEPSGNVAVWKPGATEQVLPGTEIGYPNGVVLSKDGRYAYISGWTSKSLHQYDLMAKKEVKKTPLSFMPDNITWTAHNTMLVAGIQNINGNCPATSEIPCLQGFGVAEIDPATLSARMVHDITGKAWITGVATAIEAGGSIYVGAFQGDRIVKLPRK